MSKKNSRQKFRFVSYFNLWDAFQEPGCPICTLLEKDSFRYLDGLLYERVNDGGTRVGLRESLGFCNWHAWKTLEVPNCSLGLGIIYQDILKRIEERLAKVQDFFPTRVPFLNRLFRRGKAVTLPTRWIPTQRCPACRHALFFENLFLETLLDFLTEADFERQFSHSPGVCFPHLIKAMEEYPQHKNLPLLIKKQIEKFESLTNEVVEFVRKQDFQYADEPRGSEVDSWKRALEIVVGKREIFPNQMGRERVGDEQALNSPPSAFLEEQAKGAEGEEDSEEVVEKLKFENEKWRRKYEELREEYTKESSRASSLHYIAWKTTEDNKTLKMNLAGANPEAKGLAEHVKRLKGEIERLKELLEKQGQCDSTRDKID